jgi:quinol monooxygenase YgiN
LQFANELYRVQFLEDFAPLAAYVRENEPLTLAYEALQSDQDPLKILILERYADKEHAFLQVHRSSKAFLEFRPKLKSMQDAGFVKVEGSSYNDTMLGFGDRSCSNNVIT